MTVKLGDAVALTLNGTRYKVVKDVEPQINKGGKSASEAQEYGDGTADPYFVNSAGGITGLKVVVEEEKLQTVKATRKAIKKEIEEETKK